MSASKSVLVPYRIAAKVAPYVAALERVGLTAAPHDVSRAGNLAGVAGLLLTGGTDVDPRLYGELPEPETDQPDRERDDRELGLLTEAMASDLPVLAICRGAQLLNVHRGGTLIQHLASARHNPDRGENGAIAHTVSVCDDTLLAQILRTGEAGVNSRHHQAIARLGSGVRLCSVDPLDQTVEGIDISGRRWVLGVQWHPEDRVAVDPLALALFSALAAAVSA